MTTAGRPRRLRILLVDIARHVANAYAQGGIPMDVALRRMKNLFDAEWSRPTGTARDITGKG